MDPNPRQAAADRLSAKLNALDLDPDELAVLQAICSAGADSVEGDVEGFAFEPVAPTPDGAAEPIRLTIDLRKSSGGGQAAGQMFLVFTFKLVA
jgi:hypothetical protein